MRSLPGKLYPSPRLFSAWFILLCLIVSGVTSGRTQQASQLPNPIGQQPPRVPFGQQQDTNQDPAARHAQEEAGKLRNVERQNRLVADTNKLVQLAQELKTEVDKSNKDMLSVSVVKKAEEIEKLAKSVKERMKSE